MAEVRGYFWELRGKAISVGLEEVLTVYSEPILKKGCFSTYLAKNAYYGQNVSQMARYGPEVFEVIIWPGSEDTFGI